MGRTYDYKRVATRKFHLAIFIAVLLLVVVFFATTNRFNLQYIVLTLLIIFCSGYLVFSSHRKYYIVTENDKLNIFGKALYVKDIKDIKVQENRIDIIVAKGVFILGTHLYMENSCFYSPDDWNDFKQDILNIKSKLTPQ